MIHTVYLVGAGPGDPGLITVKGARAVAQADVIVADRLVAPSLLPAQGKEIILRGEHRSDLPQAEINRVLVEKAREGRRVVRLKGGDPFVFGRGGEEAEALRAAGVPFEIVPGVTAAIAAPEYAGIPVTHRGVAGAVAFVTGHEADDKSAGHVDWESLARGATTLVVYMSVTHLPSVVARLRAAGRPGRTPVAVIERGTTPRQRTIAGTLDDIAEKARAAGVAPPALTIVGEVVRLRDALSWFESRPRPGARILQLGPDATSAEKDPDDDGEWRALDEELAARGVERVLVQPLRVERLPANLRPALADLARYRVIALTSRNGALALRDALREADLDARALAHLRLACLDGATAQIVRSQLLLRPDITARGGGTALADAILADAAPRGPVLFPRASGGREELVARLQGAGVEVDVADAYATLPDDEALRRAIDEQRRAPFAAVAFGSPRGAAAFLDAGGAVDGCLVGAIGQTTAAALADRGIPVDVIAPRPSYTALVAELAAALERRAKIR